MRIALRQIIEKSQEISKVDNWLESNMRKMSNWEPDFVELVFGQKDPKWSRAVGRDYERGIMVLRASRKLVNEALHKLLPNSKRQEILELTSKIINSENILKRFENVYVEAKTTQT